jgi:peroxiredoxin family protein
MADEKKEIPLKKVMIIVSKGSIEDVYAGLVMANGAVMEGIETKLFFTFFGLDAVIKKRQNKLKTATVGNPAMRMPGGLPFPTLLGMLPGIEAGVSAMMKKQMEALDVPPVDEFIEMIVAGGGELYACKMAFDMFKLKREDLNENVKDVITVGDLYAMSGGEGTQIIFT